MIDKANPSSTPYKKCSLLRPMSLVGLELIRGYLLINGWRIRWITQNLLGRVALSIDDAERIGQLIARKVGGPRTRVSRDLRNRPLSLFKMFILF